jgi:nicotinamide riboside kinase
MSEVTKMALVGAGCTGKTSLLHDIATDLNGRDNVEFVDEAAREYFTEHPQIPEDDRFRYEAQSIIQAMQWDKEVYAHNLYPDLIICDRSVLDAPVYVAATGDKEGATKLLERVASWLPSYTLIFLLDPEGIPFQPDEVRNECGQTRAQLHQGFLSFFALHSINHVLLRGPRGQRLATIKKHVDAYLP